MSAGERPLRVGPVLLASAVGYAIASAIRSENPAVSVVDRGSYVRVSSEGPCRVSREAIERELGSEFRWPHDLEAAMASFAGSLDLSETEARWS